VMADSDINLRELIADITDKAVTVAMARSHGEKREAARRLGIGEWTWHRLINKRLNEQL